jgi:integrase
MGLKANVKSVEHAKVGRHQIEGVTGLYLHVGDNSARWLFRYHRADGRPTETGLGSLGDVTLAQATDKARELRLQVKSGADPVALKRAKKLERQRETNGKTFADVVGGYANVSLTRSRAAAVRLVRRHAATLMNLPPGDIDADRIDDALQPTLKATPKTARRALNVVADILEYARARKLLPHDHRNPALWRGGFQHLWMKPPPVAHHRALDYRDCPALFARLTARSGSTAAMTLAYLMLCGSRSNEVLGARRDEVSGDVWTIPAERMKNRKAHVVPLTEPALVILAAMRERFPTSDYLFPADHGGRLSSRALEGLLHRRLGLACSVHGFRSSLRDWLGTRPTCQGKPARRSCRTRSAGSRARIDGRARRRRSGRRWSCGRPISRMELDVFRSDVGRTTKSPQNGAKGRCLSVTRHKPCSDSFVTQPDRCRVSSRVSSCGMSSPRELPFGNIAISGTAQEPR